MAHVAGDAIRASVGCWLWVAARVSVRGSALDGGSGHESPGDIFANLRSSGA